MRKISIFGSTGSVGQTTLRVIENDPDAFEVVVLSGHRNAALLAKQVDRFNPRIAVVADADTAQELAEQVNYKSVKILFGQDGLLEAARQQVDVLMSAIVGFAGLAVSLEGSEHANVLALANKESLVCAGTILKETCAQYDTKLIPVDSEHSALYQCLRGEKTSEVERLILTASGGPFLHMSTEQMRVATPQMAVKHPNWDMGQRISIDSASMFNKAMEVIEAKELFDVSPDRIEVVVHPQSIIHSMVGFCDKSIVAQMGPPDMTGAIGFAMNFPQRRPLVQERLDFTKLSRLDFQPVDNLRFSAINLAHRAMSLGPLAGAVFNASKEKGLDLFIAEKIGFLDMAEMVSKALDAYTDLSSGLDDTIDSVIEIDARTRDHVTTIAARGGVNV